MKKILVILTLILCAVGASNHKGYAEGGTVQKPRLPWPPR